MVEIRRAGIEDLEWIVQELRAFSDFFGSKKPLFPGEERARLGIINLIENHVVFIAERPDTIEFERRLGFIAGNFSKHPFNEDISVLVETFWWVTPSARGGSAGYRLLNEFVEYGRTRADWISISLEANSPVNTDALESRGFKLQERAFLMEVV